MSNGTAVLDEVTETESSPKTFVRAILSGLAPEGRVDLPVWFRARQEEAWKRFESLPMPHRKDQAWRFSNVDALDLSSYHGSGKVSDRIGRDLLERSTGLKDVAARLVFADDHLVERDALSPRLREQGVIVKPLERALHEDEDLVRRHFMSEPSTLGSAKFAALHEARVSSGVFIHVPKGVELDGPIEVFHWLHAAEAAAFPHLLLVADELSRVTVVEHFLSSTPGVPGFACGVNDLIAGRGAKVTYVCVQDWGRDVVSLQMNTTTVARDASVLSLNLNLGGRYSRFEGLSKLIGENSRSDMLAISVADGRQEFDARTLQDHVSPHATSDLLFKNALQDRSRCTFGGLIRVEPHAHFTDAYQKVRNLLLSDDAEANSMPGLEILADNVKCSHGATSGQMDESEMFYLLSRGIPPRVARQLLVSGFLNEVVARLDDADLAEMIRADIEAKFERHHAVIL